MAKEPEHLVLSLLRDIRSDVTKGFADVRSDIKSLRADVASAIYGLDAKIEASGKNTREQIVGLRRAVVEYHSAVIGHGIIISEFEERLRRLEQHANLPPIGGH